MKSYIIKIKGHAKSEEQAEKCINSTMLYGFDSEFFNGTTPKTLADAEKIHNFGIMKPSRVFNFRVENLKKYLTKKSCFMNHVILWNKCLEINEPIVVLEHDALAIRKWDNATFKEVLILNINSAKKHNRNVGSRMGKYEYKQEGHTEIHELNYPFRYKMENIWKGGCLMPGTAAYAITPAGATKLLDSLYKNGWDQSDFFINSKNVHIEYASPEYFGFNGKNLNTSKG
jgi:GR25 family glycosyltransferase involved in LPS biosynthesis